MAEQTTDTVVVDFKINEGEAVSSLEKTKKVIIDLKTQQTELNKAYKDGTVSLDQYAKESVQLEASLKKQQASYSAVQRQVTGLKSPFDKLNESIKEQAKQVTVAGVSLSAFANPVTATIAVLGGLFKAYSSSTVGAKDLEFASNQLGAALGMVTNRMALLISTGEDGEGFFSKLTDFGIRAAGGLLGDPRIGRDLANASKEQAIILEQLEDLERRRLVVQAENQRRQQEILNISEKISDSEIKYEEKVRLSNQAVTAIRLNRDALLKVSNEELALLEKQLEKNQGNEKLESAIKLKKLEIEQLNTTAEQQETRIEKIVSNIADANERTVEAKRKTNEQLIAEEEKYLNELVELQAKHRREKEIEEAQKRADEVVAEEEKQTNIVTNLLAGAAAIKKVIDKSNKDFAKSEKDKTKITETEQTVRLLAISNGLGMAAGLFARDSFLHKTLAIARATIDTYVAATAALKAGPFIGPVLAGLMIAAGLANVQKIVDVNTTAAAGGGSFYTKGPQLLMVGDNPGGVERVDVTPVSGRGKTVVGSNMVAMAGGGTMYTDASIAAGGGSMSSMQKIQIEFAYNEFRELENSVLDKESLVEA